MNKFFWFILFILIELSCSNHSKPEEKKAEMSDFDKNFSHLDTTQTMTSIGCSNEIFQIIDSNYILHIIPNTPIQFESCTRFSIGELNRELNSPKIELWVFDDGNANLFNICTDLIIDEDSENKQKHILQPQKGEFILGYTPSEIYGHESFQTSVHIKNLKFKDQNGKIILLENKLIWKVQDLGTPG